MLNRTSKHFEIFDNTTSAIWVINLTMGFLHVIPVRVIVLLRYEEETIV